VAPTDRHLGAADDLEAGAGERALEPTGVRQSIREMPAAGRGAERLEREVQSGGLVALGIVGEGERVEGHDRVELRVGERQRVHPAQPEVGLWDTRARDGEQLRRDVDPGHVRPERRGQAGCVLRAAADVEQTRAGAHPEPRQHSREQGLVQGLGEVRPVLRPASPVLGAHRRECRRSAKLYAILLAMHTPT
jgi:hypothetical protein